VASTVYAFSDKEDMRHKILKILSENTQVINKSLKVISATGCAMAQEVSFRPLNTVASVQSQAHPVGSVVDTVPI
jgi:hypothetical protein